MNTDQPAAAPQSSLPFDVGNPTVRDLNAIEENAQSMEEMFESGSGESRTEESAATATAASSSVVVDPQLVRETRMQIRNIVHEIGQLAEADCSVEEFFDGFLPRLTSALASVSGAVWRLNEAGRLELQYQINLAKTGLFAEAENRTAHDLLLNRLIDSPESTLVQPQSGTKEAGEPGNPTDYLLAIEPLKIDRQVVGLVEVFQRPGSGPATQRGYLRFLTQMCAIANDFLRNHRLRLFRSEQQLWEKLEGFIRGVHNDLDPRQTAFTIANDGRRLIGCDRVSVARQKGSKYSVQVVSGLDSIDRRAADIKLLNELTKAVVKADKPLWFNGDTSDLSPQIESRLQRYVDKSHAKLVVIVPLHETEREDQEQDTASSRKKRPQQQRKLGALIIEQLADIKLDASFRKRVDVVVAHSSDALTNSARYDMIFLKSVWERVGHVKTMSLTAIPAWVLIMAALAVAIFLMCVTPYNFELGSEGQLTPSIRQEVFAPADGVLTDLYVPDDPQAIVQANQPLARLTNEVLNVEIENLKGRYQEINERIKAIVRTLNQDNGDIEIKEQLALQGEASELEEKLNSIRRSQAIKNKQYQDLNILSPARGQVVTWQLKEKLLRRPVKIGDNIMTVVDPEGPWEVELEFPEKKMGHLLEAQKTFGEALRVTFVLASDPQKQYLGRIVKIDRKADVRGDQGNTVLLRAEFDKSSFPQDLLRAGTRVTARVHCGVRPIGYVLFHDAIETVQQKILFWF